MFRIVRKSGNQAIVERDLLLTFKAVAKLVVSQPVDNTNPGIDDDFHSDTHGCHSCICTNYIIFLVVIGRLKNSFFEKREGNRLLNSFNRLRLYKRENKTVQKAKIDQASPKEDVSSRTYT